MDPKCFILSPGEIKPLVRGIGGCIAADMITVGGHPVRFMYRESPDNSVDSGWRFLDPRNHAVYDVNTIANHDPSIIPFLDAPVGSVYERADGSEQFEEVTDWSPPED